MTLLLRELPVQTVEEDFQRHLEFLVGAVLTQQRTQSPNLRRPIQGDVAVAFRYVRATFVERLLNGAGFGSANADSSSS
jgi:hypothetical protein